LEQALIVQVPRGDQLRSTPKSRAQRAINGARSWVIGRDEEAQAAVALTAPATKASAGDECCDKDALLEKIEAYDPDAAAKEIEEDLSKIADQVECSWRGTNDFLRKLLFLRGFGKRALLLFFVELICAVVIFLAPHFGVARDQALVGLIGVGVVCLLLMTVIELLWVGHRFEDAKKNFENKKLKQMLDIFANGLKEKIHDRLDAIPDVAMTAQSAASGACSALELQKLWRLADRIPEAVQFRWMSYRLEALDSRLNEKRGYFSWGFVGVLFLIVGMLIPIICQSEPIASLPSGLIILATVVVILWVHWRFADERVDKVLCLIDSALPPPPKVFGEGATLIKVSCLPGPGSGNEYDWREVINRADPTKALALKLFTALDSFGAAVSRRNADAEPAEDQSGGVSTIVGDEQKLG
jgi:hypothetical protein